MMTNNSSCANTDDKITFSNRDHLDWDQKKQDMILNLGLANNSETDQTPTPTRLIRNCEEVGLFQDLQIVNPFDEVFKKAVENGSSTSLKVPVSTSDDTLHTPQIYPQLEETPKFQNKTAFAPNEYSFSNVISTIDQRDDGDNPLVIALDQDKERKDIEIGETSINYEDRAKVSSDPNAQKDETGTIKDVRQKVKSYEIVPVSIDKLLDPVRQNSKNEDELFQKKVTDMLRQREANKAAQSRCRKRKQEEFENMKAENKRLKDENRKLKTVNLYLQETLKKLQEELKEARSSNGEPSGPSETQPCVEEQMSSLSVDQIKKKKLCSQKLKSQVVSPPIVKAVAPSSEGTPVQNTGTSIAQCSSALQNPTLTSHITPAVLSKQVNIDNTLKTSLKPLPIAPKPVIVSLPLPNNNNSVGIPVPSSNNVSHVVFVYPKASPPVILPIQPVHILNDTEKLKAQKSNFKKIRK